MSCRVLTPTIPPRTSSGGARRWTSTAKALAKGTDITQVEPWNEDGRPFGLRTVFTTGAQLWAALTTVPAEGEKLDQPETPVTGEPPAEVPLPELYQNGKVTAARAELYLAALFTNAGNPEVVRAYGYSDRPVPAMHPGVGLTFHSGRRANLPFVHPARAGHNHGSRAYDLQSEL